MEVEEKRALTKQDTHLHISPLWEEDLKTNMLQWQKWAHSYSSVMTMIILQNSVSWLKKLLSFSNFHRNNVCIDQKHIIN